MWVHVDDEMRAASGQKDIWVVASVSAAAAKEVSSSGFLADPVAVSAPLQRRGKPTEARLAFGFACADSHLKEKEFCSHLSQVKKVPLLQACEGDRV